MTESVKLPSLGKIYENFPDEGLLAKPLSVKNIKELCNLPEDSLEAESRMMNIVQTCVPNFDVTKLSKGDYMYLLYWLRIKTYNNFPLNLEFRNPETGKVDNVTVDLTTLSAIDLSDKDVSYETEVTLSNGRVIHVRYPTIEDDHHVTQYLMTQNKSVETDPGDKLISVLSLVVREFRRDKMVDTIAALEDEEEGLSPDDLKTLSDLLISLSHGVNEEVVVHSTDSEGNPMTYSRTWSLRIEHFFPFR